MTAPLEIRLEYYQSFESRPDKIPPFELDVCTGLFIWLEWTPNVLGQRPTYRTHWRSLLPFWPQVHCDCAAGCGIWPPCRIFTSVNGRMRRKSIPFLVYPRLSSYHFLPLSANCELKKPVTLGTVRDFYKLSWCVELKACTSDQGRAYKVYLVPMKEPFLECF